MRREGIRYQFEERRAGKPYGIKKEFDMLEYEFETVSCDYESGYSLFGGVGLETDGHREIILRRGAEGWRYAGFVPKKQRAGGFIESIELIFEREQGGEA